MLRSVEPMTTLVSPSTAVQVPVEDRHISPRSRLRRSSDSFSEGQTWAPSLAMDSAGGCTRFAVALCAMLVVNANSTWNCC